VQPSFQYESFSPSQKQLLSCIQMRYVNVHFIQTLAPSYTNFLFGLTHPAYSSYFINHTLLFSHHTAHHALHYPHQTLLLTFNFSTLTLSFHYTCHYTTHYITLTITPHFALRYTTQFSRHDITLHQTLYYTLSAILDTSHYTTHFFTPHLTLRDTLHYTSHYISTSYGCIAWDAAILVQGVL
jgi:hypothetical protein